MTHPVVGQEQENDFVSDLEKGDSLEEEKAKENKEEKDWSKKLRGEALEDSAKKKCIKK